MHVMHWQNTLTLNIKEVGVEETETDTERAAWVRPLGFSELVTVKVKSETLIYVVQLSVL